MSGTVTCACHRKLSARGLALHVYRKGRWICLDAKDEAKKLRLTWRDWVKMKIENLGPLPGPTAVDELPEPVIPEQTHHTEEIIPPAPQPATATTTTNDLAKLLIEQQQYTEYAEQENARLEGVIASLQQELQVKQAQIDLAARSRETTEHQLNATRSESDHLRRRVQELVQSSKTVGARLRESNTLKAMPRNLTEVIEWIREFWPDRLIFTEKALRSATRAQVNEYRPAVDGSFTCLWVMALELWPLHFEHNSRRIMEDFRTKTGLQLSLTEGACTRQRADLMQLRLMEFEGETFSIESNVKYDAPGRHHLRVYYAACPVRRKLIIGHCGDHLDNIVTCRSGAH